jgi:hypothetical protein
VSVHHTYLQRTDTKYTLVTERDHTGSAYVGGVPGTNSKGSFVYQVLTVKGHL